jgi:hypothetical protein
MPPGRGSERPHRLLVRVDFRTDVDLAQLAFRRGSTVMAMSFFCGMDNRNTSIGPPTVYRRGHPVYRHQRPDEEPIASPRSLEYYFFFNAERRTLATPPYFVTRWSPEASTVSLPPQLLRLLPAGAFRRVGLSPIGKRRLFTAHPR